MNPNPLKEVPDLRWIGKENINFIKNISATMRDKYAGDMDTAKAFACINLLATLQEELDIKYAPANAEGLPAADLGWISTKRLKVITREMMKNGALSYEPKLNAALGLNGAPSGDFYTPLERTQVSEFANYISTLEGRVLGAINHLTLSITVELPVEAEHAIGLLAMGLWKQANPTLEIAIRRSPDAAQHIKQLNDRGHTVFGKMQDIHIRDEANMPKGLTP